MATGILKVKGDKLVGNDNKPIVLRGTSLPCMNMENFIVGFPGHEQQFRASMKRVLGDEKQAFFFDKFLEYFFTDADAAFLASKGINCLRIPFNYRHFEDDMNPRVLKEGCWKFLDRYVDIVRQSPTLRDCLAC